MKKLLTLLACSVLLSAIGASGYLLSVQNQELEEVKKELSALHDEVRALISSSVVISAQITALRSSGVAVDPSGQAQTAQTGLLETGATTDPLILARDTQRVTDITDVCAALQTYYSDRGAYPAGSTYAEIGAALVAFNYLQVLPVDPVNTGTMVYWYNGSANGCPMSAYLETTDALFSYHNLDW